MDQVTLGSNNKNNTNSGFSGEITGVNIDRNGKYLWIQKPEAGTEFNNSTARISSSSYRNSRSDCSLRFWYYIGAGFDNHFIKPAIHPDGAEKDIFLDFLGASVEWKTKTISIGRRRGVFQVKL